MQYSIEAALSKTALRVRLWARQSVPSSLSCSRVVLPLDSSPPPLRRPLWRSMVPGRPGSAPGLPAGSGTVLTPPAPQGKESRPQSVQPSLCLEGQRLWLQGAPWPSWRALLPREARCFGSLALLTPQEFPDRKSGAMGRAPTGQPGAWCPRVHPAVPVPDRARTPWGIDPGLSLEALEGN